MISEDENPPDRKPESAETELPVLIFFINECKIRTTCLPFITSQNPNAGDSLVLDSFL